MLSKRGGLSGGLLRRKTLLDAPIAISYLL